MKVLGGSLAGAPSAVSSAPDRLDVFAVGPANTPWHWRLEAGTWIGPSPLAPAGRDGVANIPAVGLCAVSSGPGRLEVFAAGSNGNTPWWWRLDGTVWSGPVKLPSGLANLLPVPIAAVASGPDRIEVFAAGAGNTPWWWRWNGMTWNGPTPLPLGANLPPERIAVVSVRPGRLDVFAAGAANHLWHWSHQDPSGWSGPADLGGNLPQEGVSAVCWGPDRIDVFGAAIGPGANPLQHWWWDGSRFNGPEELGGNLAAGTVSAVSRGPNRLDVFGVSGNGRLARWQWQGRHWTGPSHHGDNLPAGDVSAVSRGPDRVDVFARGTDNTLRKWPGTRLDNTTNQPWTNLAMNWQIPSVANFSPMAPVPPLGPLAGHCYPDSLEELVDIVKEAERVGRHVRAVGSSWSNSDVAITPDFLVETNKLNGELVGVLGATPSIVKVDPTYLVHVEAGMTLGELILLLDTRGLAMATLGGASGQTLAGAVSTSVHGTDFRLGPIPDVVRAIHLVGPGGIQHWIEPTQGITDRFALSRALGIDDANIHQDDDWFNSVLVSVGSLGIIYSLIIEVVPQYDLVQKCEWLTWPTTRARLQQGAPDNPFDDAGNRAVNVIVNPFLVPDGSRPCFLITRQEAPPTGPGSGSGPADWMLVADPLLRSIFETNIQKMAPIVTAITYSQFPQAEFRGWANTITTSPGTPKLRGLSLEIAFDATNDAYLDFVDEACDILHRSYVHDSLGLAGWFSLRFVGQSRAYLSPQHRFARTCMVEFAALQELSHTLKLLARLEAAGRRHGGIQHWGMFDDLRYEDVTRSYQQLDTWLRVRNQLTNNGAISTFDNAFMDRCGLIPAAMPKVLLRDPSDGSVHVIYGGAKLHVPNPETLLRMFAGIPIHDVEGGEFDHVGNVPGDGTLLVDEAGKVYAIHGAAKFHVPDPATLRRVFPGFVLRPVWNGALDHIPEEHPVEFIWPPRRNFVDTSFLATLLLSGPPARHTDTSFLTPLLLSGG